MARTVKWTPRPGWLLVQRPTTEERLGSLVIPEQARSRMIGWTYEVVTSGAALEPVPDPLTGKRQPAGTAYPFVGGEWVLTPPRQAMDCDEEGLLLLPERAVWAVLT